MRPAVSINLCCYKAEPYLEETLASVFAQSCDDYELVIVNDGSPDGTESIVRRHLAAGRHIVYHRQENAGLGAARNKAMELSSGEFIAILDQDDLWEPSKLERQLRLFSRPEVGFVGSDAWRIDATGRLLGRYSERNPLRRGRILEALFLYNFVPCAAALMRRSAIERAGGFFRPDFRIAEEYELFLRLAERFEFDFVEDPLVRIRVHAESAGWDCAREREELRRAYAECLARHPDLERRLGPKAAAIKRAGLWLTPEAAAALRGEPASWGQRLKAYGIYGLSGLGVERTDCALRLKTTFRRLAAAR